MNIPDDYIDINDYIKELEKDPLKKDQLTIARKWLSVLLRKLNDPAYSKII